MQNQTLQNLPFQWAPTLGGECYRGIGGAKMIITVGDEFQMGTHPWG